ncbi:hypothetical protein MBR_09430, partial [Metarhizium brunneum ARSEF 3297]
MSLPAVLAKYLREEIIGDVEFSKSIAEARSVGNQWILRRSYSKHPHTIQEEFRIEVRDQEHVRCTLKLNVIGHDAPREDTREKIFKPRAWCGPELDIEVSEQQTNLPQHLPTSNAREFASQANTSAPQTSIDDTATPAATESELDKQSDGVADEQDDQKQDNKVARYILLMAQYFVKGSLVLVKKPTKLQRTKLAGIRQCVKETQESDEAGDIVRLPALWRRWKKEGVKEDKIFSTTFSHTEELKRSVASMHNVGYYLAGITQHDKLRPPGHPPPTKRKNTTRYYCARAVERMLKLVSRVSQYYGTSAMTIPTFLEIGGFSMTSFGHTTISSDESFFYDGLVSLIDLSWRRLAAAQTETDQNIQTEQDAEIDHDAREAHSTMTEQDAVPVLNPFGFHSFYTDADYNATCKTLDQSIFLKAPQTVSYELPTSKILRKGRERSDSTSNGNPTSGLSDESSAFILRYAQSLAKHITHDEKVERTKGYKDNEENLELALRVLDGNALPEELATASIIVVYIIVDILLDRCPRPKRPGQERRQKRKRASEKATYEDAGMSHDCLPDIRQNCTGQVSLNIGGYGNHTFIPGHGTTFAMGSVDSTAFGNPAIGHCGQPATTPNFIGQGLGCESAHLDDFRNAAGDNFGDFCESGGDSSLFNESDVITGLPFPDRENFRWDESNANIGLPTMCWGNVQF